MRLSLPLLLALAACGGSPAPAPAPPPPVEPEPVAGPDDPVLLDAGAEPRRRLRYRLVEGTRQHEMDFTMSMDIAGQVIETPPMLMGGSLEVRDIAADGSHQQIWLCDRTDVRPFPTSDPAVVDALRSSMAALEGMRMRMHYSDRGRLLDTETTGGSLPPEAQQTYDQVTDGMQNLVTTLPVEAVGVGARWSLDEEKVTNGLTMRLHTVTEIVELTETSVRLRARMEMDVPRQDMPSDAGPMPVVGGGGGTVDTTVDLTTLASSLTSRIDLEFVVDPDGARVTMQLAIGMGMRVR
jgi:hypothetical protein